MLLQADLLGLLALTVAAPVLAQDAPPEGAGPHATSNEGEQYDAVGYAGAAEQTSGVSHPTLPIGSYVEVTALDNGRSALFQVSGTTTTAPVALSGDALRQLGVTEPGAPVRVRSAEPSPVDVAAIRSGKPASARLDAPAGLIAGLRRMLPARETPVSAARAPSPIKPKPPLQQRPVDPPHKQVPVAAKPAVAPTSGWAVQVAALTDAARARALAGQLGGTARPAGKFWRVQLGPFADRKGAEAARANIIKRGHPQATLVQIP